ncbi:hypothetical protein BDP27DRAFT_1447521 [Rhodocollybia butyracea]|uniref:Uncharacterized protein n=1 Tax=Rhodocollybia butyracea TaxID=206335 RepID=A0A9P5PUJ3_9AGAR|nr:hypothetical protein BDP27DRAFT_1447521 [Rhodocollybia butyracea]
MGFLKSPSTSYEATDDYIPYNIRQRATSITQHGGVGESPAPIPNHRDTSSSRRKSLVSLFTFNSSSKKQTESYEPHPYAYPFPILPPVPPPLSAPPKTHFVTQPLNPLKNSISTPDLRRAKPKLKGKDRWLSAETWCDALLFPRPRFKVKPQHDRSVSPPASPVAGYFSGHQPSISSRVLAHSRSLVNLTQQPLLQVPPTPTVPTTSTSRPPRPKSWALDDLALPSPEPSLSRVLEEGQILEHQRKKWQAQAVNSFQNTRSRSLSRSRAKSLQPNRKDTSRLDFLAARGLLGDQSVPSITVVKPRQRLDSETGTGTGTDYHTSSLPRSSKSQSHSRNHSRSESLGKSAVKIVKNAALCAFEDDSHVEDTNTNMNTGGDRNRDIEVALQAQNNFSTRVIRLADPATINIEYSRSGHSISPTPSGISESRIGIALVAPTETHTQSQNHEPIRMPAHPYAQGGLSFYKPSSHDYDNDNDYAPEHDYDFQSNAKLRTEPPYSRREPRSSREPQHKHRLERPQNLAPSPWHPYATATASSSSPQDSDSYQSSMKITPYVRLDSSVPPSQKMWAAWPGTGGSGIDGEAGDDDEGSGSGDGNGGGTVVRVQEVLPNEIQYSPFLSDQTVMVSNGGHDREDDFYPRSRIRNSSPIYDTAGIGETLALAAMHSRSQPYTYSYQQRYSRDSGVGTSEDHTPSQQQHGLVQQQQQYQAQLYQQDYDKYDRYPDTVSGSGSGSGSGSQTQQRSRKTTQYDVTRPLYLQKNNSPTTSTNTNTNTHTLLTASSLPQAAAASTTPTQTPPPPEPGLKPSPRPVNLLRQHSSESSANRNQSQSQSPPPTQSTDSSPPISPPPPMGNVDDMEIFHDLFFKPDTDTLNSRAMSGHTAGTYTHTEGSLPNHGIPWDVTTIGSGSGSGFGVGSGSSGGARGSGLTSIARQLTEELGGADSQSRVESFHPSHSRVGSINHSISLRSQSSLSALRQSLYDANIRTPPLGAGVGSNTDSDGNGNGMRFVFEDIPEMEITLAEHGVRNGEANILTFKPSSIQIPEDVESSRASSPMRSPVDNHNANELDVFRVGNIESVTTPPAVSGENRVSFSGQIALAIGDLGDPDSAEPRFHPPHDDATPTHSPDTDISPTSALLTHTTAHSSLQPPPTASYSTSHYSTQTTQTNQTNPTRSSYMTSDGDAGSMSGLSDFPDPPPQQMTPAHMSLLSTYFDEGITAKEIEDVRVFGHVKMGTRSRSGSVLTGGLVSQQQPQQDVKSSFEVDGDEEIDDLIASLSPRP